jgi:hypothetical protein
MLKKLFYALIIMFVLSAPNFYAQVEDSTEYVEKDEGWWQKWDEQEWFNWEFHGKPFIELNYGLGEISRKDFYYNFATNGAGEIKLGYASNESIYEDYNISEFHDRYFFISRLGSNLSSSDAKSSELRFDMWRFGFSKRKGYGYNIGPISIIPYHAEGFIWSRLNMKNFPADVFKLSDPPEAYIQGNLDTHFLNRINGEFKFGTTVESGINLNLASTIGFNVGYESTVVFPRHMFWKHLGSMIIESAGLNMLDHFIEEVADASPMAAPLVNAILKGAYSYAFYILKKDKMNWPFETEAPLTTETFKFGITFTF